MRQVISSHSTLIYKSIVPLFSVALSVFLLFTLFFSSTESFLDGLIVNLMMVGAAGFFCWSGAKLKQVRIDEHNFYVAGFFKEISIPITAIYSVGGFQTGSLVTLRLKEKSEFGRTIFFLARWRFVFPWEVHPIFEELGQLVRKNRSANR